MPEVKKIIINENVSGQRLDNFLLNQLKGVPKSKIYSIIRKGEIRINCLILIDFPRKFDSDFRTKCEYWEINLMGIMIHEKIENTVLEIIKNFEFRLYTYMDKYTKIYQIFIIFRLH